LQVFLLSYYFVVPHWGLYWRYILHLFLNITMKVKSFTVALDELIWSFDGPAKSSAPWYRALKGLIVAKHSRLAAISISYFYYIC